jgi:carbon-monoxide dehydrogenase large subunit
LAKAKGCAKPAARQQEEKVTATGPAIDHRDAERLLKGGGRFVEDAAKGAARGVFLRSPHAAARILAIDTREAAAMPGVIAVLTEADVGPVGNLSRPIPMKGRGGARLIVPVRPALAGTQVRHVGEAVALVVAESNGAAADAAERIAVDYEPLPAVTDTRRAAAQDAPLVWDEAPGNVALDWPGPQADPAANWEQAAQAFAGAAHVARLGLVSQRVAVVSLEPRAALAAYDSASGRYTIRCGSQSASRMAQELAAILKIEPAQMQAISDDVGGAFGMKSSPYPEYVALLAAARRAGRPVLWTATRGESFLSDTQGRDIVIEGELALDRDGKFLALRARCLANMGAYLAAVGTWVPTMNFASCLPTVYDIPEIAVEVRCLFTNTAPVGPYRGAGRPDANYLVERLVEEAARLSGIDALEIRRRNLIPPDRLPYRTAVGTQYDSGDFPALLERALALADQPGFAARRARAAAAGKLRGLGISCFSEIAGGQPGEQARVTLLPDGRLQADIASQASGQNHRRVFAELLAQRFGLEPGRIDIRYGDSALGVRGIGSIASRGAMSTGSALVMAADALLAKARSSAAILLQAKAEELVFAKGGFEIAGSGRRVGLAELGGAESLSELATADIKPTFPSGCHIAEIEIDRDTGQIRLRAYSAVDDCGTVLDHEIVEGQIQGGIAQGVGQALSEDLVYEPGSGQLLTGSLMDYGVPHADDLPLIATELLSTAAKNNALGVKGVGEAGTTGALAAVMNAVEDALAGIGATCPDMPVTPYKIWQAIRAAR